MAKIGDFVKIEYAGYDESGKIFDSTQGDIAKQLHEKEGSMLIVLGVDYLVKGMEEAVLSMEKGEEREINLGPEKAFGKRRRDFLKVFSTEEFYRNKLDPQPGEIVRMETGDGPLNGLVKSVNSGRVLVDFNHPLADKNIRYKIKLVEAIGDVSGKVGALMKDLAIEGSFSLEGAKAIVTIRKGQPEEDLKKTRLLIAVKSAIQEIKDVEFRIQEIKDVEPRVE